MAAQTRRLCEAKAGQGLNVDTDEIVDLVKAGIIDPAMVTRSALQNAASIAKNILTAGSASQARSSGAGCVASASNA